MTKDSMTHEVKRLAVVTMEAAALLIFASEGVSEVASGTTFTRVLTGPVVSEEAKTFGCDWADYDNDGHLDLVVGNALGHRNALYRNLGDGTFVAVTESAVHTTLGDSGGVTWGDYDNDGDVDLFVANWLLPSFLFRNDGSGTFTRVLEEPIGSNFSKSLGASWADYDRDGFIDLVVANTENENNFLYQNDQDGTFTSITDNLIATTGLWSAAPTWADYNGDGWVDLAIASVFDTVDSRGLLAASDGAGSFNLVSMGSGLWEAGTDWGDFDNDGDFDLLGYITDNDSGRSEIWVYRNDGEFFSPILIGSFSPTALRPWMLVWADYDNDGWLDFFCATLSATGSPDLLYRNNGDGTFTRVETGDIVTTPTRGVSSAWADINNDGFLDLFVGNGAQHAAVANLLFYNNPNGNRWLQIKCVGSASNRSSLGAKLRVDVVIGGVSLSLTRQVSAGNGLGGSTPRVHFGLGDASIIDRLQVTWPSGIVAEWHDILSDQILSVTEPPALRASGMNEQGEFVMDLLGGVDRPYVIDVSGNFEGWEEWIRITPTASHTEIVDTNAPSYTTRFYRVREDG